MLCKRRTPTRLGAARSGATAGTVVAPSPYSLPTCGLAAFARGHQSVGEAACLWVCRTRAERQLPGFEAVTPGRRGSLHWTRPGVCRAATMAFGRTKAVQLYLVLLVLSLTVMGNAAEFCSMQSSVQGVGSRKCTDRTNVLIAVGVLSSLGCLVILGLRTIGREGVHHAELVTTAVLLVLWAAAAGIVSSPRSSLIEGDTVLFYSTPPFFAAWGALLCVTALVAGAAADAGYLPATEGPLAPLPPPLAPSRWDPAPAAGDAKGSTDGGQAGDAAV